MNKLKFTLILSILMFNLLMPFSAYADEESPKYSFAHAQGEKVIEVIPGVEEGYGLLYFYNVDGNTITHITLEPEGLPDGWTMTFDPPLHEAQYSLGGPPITVEENVACEPTEVFDEPIADPPAGQVSLTLPKKLGGADTPDDLTDDIPGYCLGKQVNIVVNAPASATFGTSTDVIVKATAFWLGQDGSAALAQEFPFDFTINTVYEKTQEVPVTPFDWDKWLPVILAGGIGVAVLGIIYVPKLIAKRRKSA